MGRPCFEELNACPLSYMRAARGQFLEHCLGRRSFKVLALRRHFFLWLITLLAVVPSCPVFICKVPRGRISSEISVCVSPNQEEEPAGAPGAPRELWWGLGISGPGGVEDSFPWEVWKQLGFGDNSPLSTPTPSVAVTQTPPLPSDRPRLPTLQSRPSPPPSLLGLVTKRQNAWYF